MRTRARSVAFSPDGRLLASGLEPTSFAGGETSVSVWDVASQELVVETPVVALGGGNALGLQAGRLRTGGGARRGWRHRVEPVRSPADRGVRGTGRRVRRAIPSRRDCPRHGQPRGRRGADVETRKSGARGARRPSGPGLRPRLQRRWLAPGERERRRTADPVARRRRPRPTTGRRARPRGLGHGDRVRAATSRSRSAGRRRSGSGFGVPEVGRWDTRTDEPSPPVSIREGDVLALSPDGRAAAVGDDRGTVTLVDAETGEATIPAINAHAGKVSALAFSVDGRTLVSSGCRSRRRSSSATAARRSRSGTPRAARSSVVIGSRRGLHAWPSVRTAGPWRRAVAVKRSSCGTSRGGG